MKKITRSPFFALACLALLLLAAAPLLIIK
jgi:hypothetical protein